MAAEDFIITKKRKKYKFARFSEFTNCLEAGEWADSLVRQAFLAADRRIIELGAGTGFFLVEQAGGQPAGFHVAVDVKADRLYAGAKQALDAGIGNIYFVRAHAEQLVDLFGEAGIDELWLTFSDPFPKKRQAKHRMTHPRFLDIYRRLLKENGILHFKTDNHTLFDWSLEQFIASDARLERLSYDLHASQLPDGYKVMTTYEQRFHGEGLPIYAVDVLFDRSSC